MIDWFKRLLGSQAAVSPLWTVMEKMDPLLSFERFRKLKLTGRQRPTVQGLIDGTVKPTDLDVVREWTEQQNEEGDGINALVFALQHVLGGSEVTYLFEDKAPAPTARFPNHQDADELTVLFNDRENHLQIASLEEFVTTNGISDYVLEPLDLSQLRLRMTSRLKRYRGITAEPSADEGRRISITIERSASAQEQLHENVDAAEIAAALNAAGVDVTVDDVFLESPLEKLGLFKVLVQLEPDSQSKVYVWVVPAV